MEKHTSITSLEIDKNISSIADYALDCSMYSSNATEYGFNSLQTITVESGNSAYVVGEDGALYSKDKTTLVLYPAKNAATELSIDEAVTTVKDYAVSGATNLTSLSFGEKVSSIGKYVINNTTNLQNITFKNATVPSFNTTFSFRNHATTGTLYVPSVNDYSSVLNAFGSGWTGEASGGMVGLIRWKYDDGVLTFTGINALNKSNDWAKYAATTRSIVIGEGITAITANNFQNFPALQSVTIPYSLTEIGTGSFQGSTLNVVNLTLPSTVLSWQYLDKFTQVKNVGALTAGKGGLLLSVNGRQLTESDYITCPLFNDNPDKDAMRYFANLYNLQISALYPQIPASFFEGWEYLKNVTFTLGNLMWKINENAFSNSSLESISIPSSITDIAANAFDNCTNLKSVTVANASSVGTVFSNRKSLESITVLSGELADRAFENSTNLKTISIGASVTFGTSYYAGPFAGCNHTVINVLNDEEYPKFLSKSLWLLLNTTSYGKTLLFDGKEKEVIVLDYENVLPRTFQKFVNVRKVVLTEKVHTMGEFCLDCSSLKHITCYGNPFMSVSNYPIWTSDLSQSATVHFRPECTYLHNEWARFKKVWNAGDVTLNLGEVGADEDGPIQLEVVNLEGDVTWSTNGSGYVSVNANGLVTLNKDFVYNGQTDRIGIVTATVNGKSGDFKVEFTPSTVVLTDGQPYVNSKAFEAESVTYTRTFSESSVGKWQALCLPFSIDVVSDDYEIGKILTFCPMKDTNGDGEIMVMTTTAWSSAHARAE